MLISKLANTINHALADLGGAEGAEALLFGNLKLSIASYAIITHHGFHLPSVCCHPACMSYWLAPPIDLMFKLLYYRLYSYWHLVDFENLKTL